jgi:Mg/Co/Ni transporter MgtE
MSAFYQVFGTIRVRKCPEAEAIITRLQNYPVGEIEIEVNECDPDVLAVSLEDGDFFAAGGVLNYDALLQSLGPYTVEPAVLVTTYEEEAGELIVARSDAESIETLSEHRVDQIEVLLREVTPEDRAELVERLQAAQAQ